MGCRALSACKSIDQANPKRSPSRGPGRHPERRKVLGCRCFESQYRLASLARETERTWESFDAILLPSSGTIYTVEEMLADPVALNTNLGRYTNFMNLLDLCGLAVPAGFRPDKIPFGVTFFAPAWGERLLFKLAEEFEGFGRADYPRGKNAFAWNNPNSL